MSGIRTNRINTVMSIIRQAIIPIEEITEKMQ